MVVQPHLIYSHLALIIFIGRFIGESHQTLLTNSKPLRASNHTAHYSAPYTLPLLFALLPLPLQHCNSVHQCSPLLAIATTASYFAAILEPCCITSLLYLTNGVHLRQGSWLLDFRSRMSVSFCTKLIFEESGSILRVVFYHKSVTLIL